MMLEITSEYISCIYLKQAKPNVKSHLKLTQALHFNRFKRTRIDPAKKHSLEAIRSLVPPQDTEIPLGSAFLLMTPGSSLL